VSTQRNLYEHSAISAELGVETCLSVLSPLRECAGASRIVEKQIRTGNFREGDASLVGEAVIFEVTRIVPLP
jgi:hypothetical protein